MQLLQLTHQVRVTIVRVLLLIRTILISASLVAATLGIIWLSGKLLTLHVGRDPSIPSHHRLKEIRVALVNSTLTQGSKHLIGIVGLLGLVHRIATHFVLVLHFHSTTYSLRLILRVHIKSLKLAQIILNLNYKIQTTLTI